MKEMVLGGVATYGAIGAVVGSLNTKRAAEGKRHFAGLTKSTGVGMATFQSILVWPLTIFAWISPTSSMGEGGEADRANSAPAGG